MSFIGKRIDKLNESHILNEDAYFIIDSAEQAEATKVGVPAVRDAVISSDLVAGSTVELQMIITQGKQAIVNGLEYQNVSADVTESFSSLEKKVEDLNTESSSDKKNVPWLYGYSIGDNTFNPNYSIETPNIAIDADNGLWWKPQDGGVLEVGKIQTNENGQTILTTLKVDVSGGWTIVGWEEAQTTKYYSWATAHDGSLILLTDGSKGENTNDFTLVIAEYNQETNQITYRKKNFSYPSTYTLSTRIYDRYDQDTVLMFLGTYDRRMVGLLNISTGAMVLSDNISYLNERSVGVYKDNLIVVFGAVGDSVYNQEAYAFIFQFDNNSITKIKSVPVVTGKGDLTYVICYFIPERNSVVGFTQDKTVAFEFSLDTLAPTSLKIEDNSTYTSDYTLYQVFGPYDGPVYKPSGFALGEAVSKDSNNKYHLICLDYINGTAVFDPANKQIIFPYISGFGVNLVNTDFPTNKTMRAIMDFVYIYNKTEATGTAYLYVGDYYSFNKKMAVNTKLDTTTINAITKDGNLYLLEDLHE